MRTRNLILIILFILGISIYTYLLITNYSNQTRNLEKINQSLSRSINFLENDPKIKFLNTTLFETNHVLRALNRLSQNQQIINHSILLMLKNHVENLRGNDYFWKFEDILPPDLDDTITSISALYGLSSYQYIYETLDALILKQLPSGAFYTWLYPDNESSQNNTEDLEVIGTFGLYLTKISIEKYYSTLIRIAEFLKQKQNHDGSWNETWYFGNYYGIYRISSFLALFNKREYQTQLENSLNEIKTTIQNDGGWGRENKSNSLDTAFCTSYLINYRSLVNSQLINNGVSYLLNHQNTSGSWEKIPFFSEYPLDIIGPEQVIYESELFTTSIVLETLLDYIIYLKNSSNLLIQDITLLFILFSSATLIFIIKTGFFSRKIPEKLTNL